MSVPKLRKVGDYNNIPDEVYEKITPLDSVAKYRYLGGLKNDDPEDAKYNGATIWPQQKGVPMEDEIVIDGNPVKIAVVKDYDSVTGKITKPHFVTQTKMTDGYFYIHKNNAEQLKMYSYFELCDYNASKPDRDPRKPAIFERIDLRKDAKVTNRRLKDKTEALQWVELATAGDIKLVAQSLQWNEDNEEVLRARLYEMADQTPTEFLRIAGDKRDLQIKAIIKQALDAEVITYDKLQGKAKMAKSGEVIATFDKSDDREFAEMLCEFIKTNTKGDVAFNSIKRLLKPVKAD